MALREFRRGAEDWVVWDTYPTAAERLTTRVGVAAGFLEGWLTFTSGDRKLRLPSVPRGWDELPDDALVALLDRASPVARNTTLWPPR